MSAADVAAIYSSVSRNIARVDERAHYSCFSMYFLAILVFFVALVCITFAEDGYLNRELSVYQRMLREPWLNRTVLLTLKE